MTSEQVPLFRHTGKQPGTLTARQPGAWASLLADGKVRDARCKMVNVKSSILLNNGGAKEAVFAQFKRQENGLWNSHSVSILRIPLVEGVGGQAKRRS